MKQFIGLALLGIVSLAVADNFEAAKHAYQTSNYTAAKNLFEKSCVSEDNPQSCAMLAVMYVNAQGVAKDNTKAKALYKRACEKNFELGCAGYQELNSN